MDRITRTLQRAAATQAIEDGMLRAVDLCGAPGVKLVG
jgi:hypothetical protein